MTLKAKMLFTSYEYCHSLELHQIMSPHKASLLFSFLKESTAYQYEKQKGGAVGLERKFSPWSFRMSPDFWQVVLKAMLTRFEKIQSEVIVSWGDVTLEWNL